MALATARDTDIFPVNENGFTATRDSLQYKSNGREFFRRLYEVSAETAAWDLGSDYKPAIGCKLMAVGSRHGAYSYIEVRVVGRKTTRGACGYDGVRVRVHWVNAEADGTIVRDDETVAWIVEEHFHR